MLTIHMKKTKKSSNMQTKLDTMLSWHYPENLFYMTGFWGEAMY